MNVKEVLKRKRETVERLKERRSLKEAILETKRAGEGAGKRAVIAEVKRRGLKEEGTKLQTEIGSVEAARRMQNGGACAISVLTDEAFLGSLEDLRAVKLSEVELPVLRKDFIFDEFQVHESYASGADAVLLIARFLSAKRLRELARKAASFGLEALVEVDGESWRKIFEADLEGISESVLVGVNNRDLKRLEVDLETFERVAAEVKPRLAELPAEVVLVAMSGIEGEEEASRMFAAGADALLVGTAVMNSGTEKIEEKVRDFVGAW